MFKIKNQTPIKPNLLLVGLLLLIAAVSIIWFFSSIVFDKKIQNVLIISIDTCRPDFLGCYGYPLKTTPNIDALASEGVLFEKAISPIPFTLPAHCSMLTGMIPPFHKVLDNTYYNLDEEKTTLAEILKDKGFSTGGFISTFVIKSIFGLAQGFDKYDDEFSNDRNTMGLVERRAKETTDRALKWLEKNKDKNNFLFVHYFDPHFTYDAPEPFASRFPYAKMPGNLRTREPGEYISFYAGEIAYVDYNIGRIIGKLKQLGIYESTLICVTSDHGESLGQHNEATHGYFVYDATIRVPLVMKIPGGKKGIRVKSLVGLVDIVPTICSVLGIELSHEIQGKDLTSYIKDPDSQPYADRHLYCQSLEPTKYDANPLLGIVTDRYKYILTKNSELYDLYENPVEIRNLIKEQPNRARLMQDSLLQIIDDATAGGQTSSLTDMDAELIQKLESLGYVGGMVTDTFTIDPAKEDPKEVIDYHVMASSIGYFIQIKNYEAAEIKCKKLIEERPEHYMGYLKTAKLLMYQEKYPEAAEYFAKVIELKPDFVYAYAGLADAYRSLEQYDKALEYLFKALQLKPDFIEAYYQLSMCYYEQGLFEKAEEYLTDILKSARRYPEVLIQLGEALVGKGRIIQAYDKFAEAVKLDPDSVSALNSVAWLQCASDIKELRDPQEALALAVKACEISHYNNPEALDTLAVAYAANDHFDKAIQTAKIAITQANSEDKEDMAERIRKRIELYKNQQIYIDQALKEQK